MVLDIPGQSESSGLPSILIYRSVLLPLSETFVLSQPESLERFTPYFVGFRRVDGLRLPEQRFHLVGGMGALGATKKILYKLFGLAPGLVSHLRRLNPVLIHAHFGVDSVQALWLARRLRIPLVVSFHGYDVTMKEKYARKYSYDYSRYLRWRSVVQKEGSLFIAVSEFVRGRLIAQGFPSDKIALHYVGVDTELFAPDPSIARMPIVLFAGRLVDSKGCGYLIEAMARVQQEIPEAQLLVIGDGPLRGELEETASRKLQNYKFLGAQSQNEVRYWMNRARVFSVPSFTTQWGTSEGFGLVFAEAQAMALPVVSFATGGIPEAVAHGVTGLLSEERDVDGLANHIMRLLIDAALWHRFSGAARPRACERFSLRQQTARLEEMYTGVLARRPAAAIVNAHSVPVQS